MSPYTTEMEMKPARSGDCGCGCGGGSGADCGCESRCCDLDCLVRPRFFCGQTLTDTDLSAAVEWARSRFALTRYRHGWGVVCGLDVLCHDPGNSRSCCGDTKDGPTIYVTPGYAIDCCGNDLVVCEPLAVSLAKICRPADDPCSSTWKPIPVAPVATPVQPAGTAAPGREPDNLEDCLRHMKESLFAVEVRLRYHETLTQAQRAMFRSGCADTSGCEYTRVHEQPCAGVEVVPVTPDKDDATAWIEEFKARYTQVGREIVRATSVDLQTALEYVRAHPPHTLCFIEDLLCCLRPAEDASNPRKFIQQWQDVIRLYLFLDWYLRQLECACWSCKPDEGVPIARVLLQRIKTGDGDRCRVVMIDAKEPYRRPLRQTGCRPTARGEIDLGQYVWQPLDMVKARMQATGVTVESVSAKDPGEARKWLDGGVLAIPAETRELRVHTISDPFDPNLQRVIAFS